MPGYHALQTMFANVVYLGYRVTHGRLIRTDNHPPIIDEDVFWYAFNKLSKVTVHGLPNPNYVPYRSASRHPIEKREGVAPPKYATHITSDDVDGMPDKRLWTHRDQQRRLYFYQLKNKAAPRDETLFTVNAPQVDQAIDFLLQERLKATVHDEDLWQQALTDARQNTHDADALAMLDNQMHAC